MNNYAAQIKPELTKIEREANIYHHPIMTMGKPRKPQPQERGGLGVPRKPPNFRRSDFQRAIRGAREEGLDIERIQVAKDGGFTLHPKPKLEITNVEDAAKQQWTRATEELQMKPIPTKKAKRK